MVAASVVQQRAPTSNSTAIIGSCGVNAQHLIVGTTDKLYLVDKSQANPLKLPGGYSATAAEYSLRDNTCRGMPLVTNAFCAGGGVLGDGQILQAGGNPEQLNQNQTNGMRAMRIIKPCTNKTCQWREGSDLQAQVDRWYPSVETGVDGDILIFGRYNAQVFLPYPKEGNSPTVESYPSVGGPGYVPILDRAWPFSLYPSMTMLKDGRFFIISVLLPLTPANNYLETVMFAGGTSLEDWGTNPYCPPGGSYAVPASNKCDLISPLGDATWQSGPDMPDRRVMGNFIILPDNNIVLINGARAGVQGFGCDGPGESLATEPALTPFLYNTTSKTWTTLAPMTLPRGYHSSATLLPDGSVLVAGSSPHPDVSPDLGPFPTEYRLEVLYPSYAGKTKPFNTPIPTSFPHGGPSFNVTLSTAASARNAYVRIIRTGWSTHGVQMGQRSYELNRTVSGRTITFQGLPSNRAVFPPGRALAFLVVNGVPSQGKLVMVGNGKLPN
ncbi:hypothetical protein V8E36_005909 [Tilletia maclaganii]